MILYVYIVNSDILSGIPSGIYSDILSDIPSNILSGILSRVFSAFLRKNCYGNHPVHFPTGAGAIEFQRAFFTIQVAEQEGQSSFLHDRPWLDGHESPGFAGCGPSIAYLNEITAVDAGGRFHATNMNHWAGSIQPLHEHPECMGRWTSISPTIRSFFWHEDHSSEVHRRTITCVDRTCHKGGQHRLFDKINWCWSSAEVEGNFMVAFFMRAERHATYERYELTCLEKKTPLLFHQHIFLPCSVCCVFSPMFLSPAFSPNKPKKKKTQRPGPRGWRPWWSPKACKPPLEIMKLH